MDDDKPAGVATTYWERMKNDVKRLELANADAIRAAAEWERKFEIAEAERVKWKERALQERSRRRQGMPVQAIDETFEDVT
jgi:beta-glucosidase/6-phospho-beta-glucosidase/beta-galactosidase